MSNDNGRISVSVSMPLMMHRCTHLLDLSMEKLRLGSIALGDSIGNRSFRVHRKVPAANGMQCAQFLPSAPHKWAQGVKFTGMRNEARCDRPLYAAAMSQWIFRFDWSLSAHFPLRWFYPFFWQSELVWSDRRACDCTRRTCHPPVLAVNLIRTLRVGVHRRTALATKNEYPNHRFVRIVCRFSQLDLSSSSPRLPRSSEQPSKRLKKVITFDQDQQILSILNNHVLSVANFITFCSPFLFFHRTATCRVRFTAGNQFVHVLYNLLSHSSVCFHFYFFLVCFAGISRLRVPVRVCCLSHWMENALSVKIDNFVLTLLKNEKSAYLKSWRPSLKRQKHRIYEKMRDKKYIP